MDTNLPFSKQLNLGNGSHSKSNWSGIVKKQENQRDDQNSTAFATPFCRSRQRMSTQSRATSLREAGNERFKKRDYEGAIDFYSQSLKVEETAAWYCALHRA